MSKVTDIIADVARIDSIEVTANTAGGIGSFIDTSIAISSDGTALANDDGSDNRNIAIGIGSSVGMTTASGNVGIGASTLASAVSSINNIGIGGATLYYNTIGYDNTNIGFQSGFNNTTGIRNIGLGSQALYGNATSKLTGSYNTGIGFQSGYNLTTGQYNVLMGYKAGYNLTTAVDSVHIGKNAGFYTTGGYNTFIGEGAGAGVSTGQYNVSIGQGSGATLSSAYITGSLNTFIGVGAKPSSTSVSNEITLGYSGISTLRCQVTTITALSDERDKTDITDLDVGLDFINSLRPVDFTWNMRDGGKVGVPEIGFIAQELQQAQIDNNKVIPQLVMDNNPDKLEAGYGALLPVMVQAIKELSSKVDDLTTELNTLKGL